MAAPRIPDAELSARIAQLQPMVDTGVLLLETVARALATGPFAISLLDRDGIALWTKSQDMRPEWRIAAGDDCARLLGPDGTLHPALGATFHERAGVRCEVHSVEGAEGEVVGAVALCVPVGVPPPDHRTVIAVAAQSITSRTRAAARPASATREERHRRWLAEIVRQTPAAIVVADAKTGRVVLANRKAEEIFGTTLARTGVLSFADGPHFAPRRPDGRELAFDEYPMVRVLSRGVTITEEELLLRAGGREVNVLLSATPIRDGDEIAAIVLTLQDVTERRAAERERERLLAAEREARALAEEAARLRERVLTVVGHDLRQPLSAVLLAIDSLAADPALSGYREVLKKTRRAAGRIDAMIRDVLDFGSVVAGTGLRVGIQEADLIGISEAAVEELQVVDPELDVQVEATGDCRGIWDEGRMEQVVTNLLVNAARYGDRSRIHLRLRGLDGHVELQVRNRGEPIPAELLEKIFKPFTRGSSRGAGLGLGLYIVREIARAHGGEVAVRSGPEETEFTVTLPRRKAAAG